MVSSAALPNGAVGYRVVAGVVVVAAVEGRRFARAIRWVLEQILEGDQRCLKLQCQAVEWRQVAIPSCCLDVE